jgi:putative spermidine/putrescine transport system permease protein
MAHVVLTLPYALLLLTTTFEGIDERIIEASRVCGASGAVLFRKILLPLSKPGLLAALFIAFTTSYNEFTLTIMTYGPRTVTLPVMTYLTIGDGFWEVSSALSMILLVPSALVLVFIIRGMSRGKLIGGLKGL